MEIFKRERTPLNNPSKTDGIGTLVLSIPPDIYGIIKNLPEFQWIFESNENLHRFGLLNPYFFYMNRDPNQKIRFIVNRDGFAFDLVEKKFVKWPN